MSKLKVIELFAGIQATSEGLRRLGVEHETYAVEFEQKVKDVSNILWNKDEPVRDVTKFDKSELPEHWNGKADMVVGGFPCQAFSRAGKQQGVNDEKGRGLLFQNMLDVIQQTQPEYVIFENVKSITDSKHIDVVHEIKEVMKSWGYQFNEQVINAKYWIPQNRERWFLYCSKKRKPEPIITPEPKLVLKDMLEQPEQVETEYLLTNQQLENLKIDWEKVTLEDITKIIKVGNCSKSGHNALNIYSVKGIAPTFRGNHGASVKIYWEDDSKFEDRKFGLDKIEKAIDWDPQYVGTLIDLIAEVFGTTDLIETKGKEKHFRLSDGTTRRIGYRKKQNNWLLPISRNYTNNIVNDISGILNTLTASNPKKIVEIEQLDKWVKWRNENSNGQFKTVDFQNSFYLPDKAPTGVTNGAYNRIWKDNTLHPTITTSGHARIAIDWDKITKHLKENERIDTFLHQTIGEKFVINGIITREGRKIGLHYPINIRSITPREAFRLMGWEDEQFDRVAHLPKSKLYHVAGNSMVVPVMQSIVEELLKGEY